MKMNLPSFAQKARLIALGGALLAASASASATGTFGDMAKRGFDQLGAFADVAIAVMFLSGLIVGGLAAFKFKAHSDNPGQNKITQPIVYAIVAALLIGLPTFLTIAKESVVGDGTAGSITEQGVYGQIQ
jgi:hypothetical protein